MGQLETNQPNNPGADNPSTTESILMSVTQELRNLQQDLLVQLSQDISRLQSEKSRLIDDIEHLRTQQEQLRSQQLDALSGRQIAQQQQWAKQLAQVLASNLQEQLIQRFSQMGVKADLNAGSLTPANSYNEDAYRLLASLDSTLNTTFRTLQQELASYQSALSQQLSRMHNMHQQGEVILEALINGLIEQLQVQSTQLPSASARFDSKGIRAELPQAQISPASVPKGTPPTPMMPVEPPPTPAVAAQSSALSKGLFLILLSSLTLSFQNVVTKVILAERSIFGLFNLGGFIAPSPGNSLLILVMRMSLVAPLMAFLVAPVIYPHTWRDIKQLTNPEQRSRLWSVVGSGICLFVSQFFIYIALGNIPTGVATTIFFVYPTITVLLAWLIFGDRPTVGLVLAMITIYIGGFLTVPSFTTGAQGNIGLGTATAVASGVTFAGYVVLIKLAKMHPAPFSVVNFTAILVFSATSLLIASVFGLDFLKFDVPAGNWFGLGIGAIVLTGTTLVGYLLNNFGVPLIGPSLASVVGASGPALTAILALIIIKETLQGNQVIGIVLVSLWVLGISVENMKRNTQPKPAAK